MASNALIEKLQAFIDLTPADREWLAALSSKSVKVAADTDLIREGDVP